MLTLLVIYFLLVRAYRCVVTIETYPDLTTLSKLNISRIAIDKGKGHPRTKHGGPEGEWRYNFTFSLTSVLDAGEWSTRRQLYSRESHSTHCTKNKKKI
jgi:hypothetical protein